LNFRRRIDAYQHAVIVWQLCRQVWARWMNTSVLAGALNLPDYDGRRCEYLACGWLPPKWDWVDPMKGARAEIEQIDAGLESRTQALAEHGYDAEQVDTEVAADKASEKDLGQGTNEIGPLMDIDLFRVVFKPGKSLSPISDEWGNIEIEGEALADDQGKFGTWTVRVQVVGP
jgi:hypothetical protein